MYGLTYWYILKSEGWMWVQRTAGAISCLLSRVGSKGQTQVSRPGAKHLYPLTRLPACLSLFVLKQKLIKLPVQLGERVVLPPLPKYMGLQACSIRPSEKTILIGNTLFKDLNYFVSNKFNCFYEWGVVAFISLGWFSGTLNIWTWIICGSKTWRRL